MHTVVHVTRAAWTSTLRWLVAVAAIAALISIPAMAQVGATATIQGTVTDPTGAVIPAAQITITNVDTGVTVGQKTTKSGFFSITALPPGTYTVTVNARGFKKLVRNNVHVNGMQVLGLNMTLNLGAATQTVTVSTAPPPLETQDATLGAALQNRVYQELPLEMGAAGSPDQQRVTDFARLMPGVSANETHNNETDEPMVVDGQAHATAMYIEGIPFTFPGGQGDPRYIWPAFGVQTVSQFQLKTSSFSAAYTGLDVENFSIKSGTNKIHGSVYDLVRNTAFDAYGFRPPVSKVTGNIYKPPEHMNEYGIDAGFPLMRNKFFFFGAFEGFRYSTVTPAVFNTIPTPAEFKGDFSATGVNIYDPTKETCTATATGTACTRPQFVYNGTPNVIPPGEISPVAQKLAQFWSGVKYANNGLTDNFLNSYPTGLSNWDGSIRLDYHLSDKQTMTLILASGRQGLVGSSATSTDVGPFPYRTAKYYRPITHVGIFEDTYVLTPNLINQFRYGASQYHSPDYNPTYPVSKWAVSNLGIGGLPPGQASGGFSEERFHGDYAPAQWGVDGGNIHDENSFNLVDDLQWVHGKHSLTFGGQIQWLEDNVVNAIGGSTPVTFNFSNAQTGQFVPGTTTLDSSTGLPFASFMVGAVDSGDYTYYAPEAQTVGSRYHPFALYINDDYRATPTFTVNMGLRWDYFPPFHEAENRWSFLNTELTNPVTGTPGVLEFAGNVAPGDSCACATPVRTYLENFGPRLGIAWQMNSKTVLRTAYGVYYTTGGGVNSGPAKNLGYSSAPSVSSPGFGLPAFYLNGNANFAGATTVQGYANDPTNTTFGGAGFSPVKPPIFNPALGTYYSSNFPANSPLQLSTTVDYVDPWYGGRAPEFEGWSFGFQRLLTPNMTATLSYVGNEAHFLPDGGARGYWNNELNPIYLPLGHTLGDSATGGNTPGGLPYPSFNNTVEQALKPFPQYHGVSDEWGSVSNTNYNALQLSIKQRTTHGLEFMLNYTYSKTMGDDGTFRTGYAIPAGLVAHSSKAYAMDRIDYSLSNIDIPQNVTFTSVWKLPLGKGHWGGTNPYVSALVGGWTLSDIFTYISGNPLEITSGSCTAPGQGQCMPAYNTSYTGPVRIHGGWGHGITRDTMAHTQFIDPHAFTATSQLPNPYQIGDVARSAPYGLRGPGNWNIDGDLRRTFNLTRSDRVKFVFEANVFNAVNHVWFGSTSTNANGSIGQKIEATPAKTTQLGVINGQANLPRQWQFEGHIDF